MDIENSSNNFHNISQNEQFEFTHRPTVAPVGSSSTATAVVAAIKNTVSHISTEPLETIVVNNDVPAASIATLAPAPSSPVLQQTKLITEIIPAEKVKKKSRKTNAQKTAFRSKDRKLGSTFILDSTVNVAVNMCMHCSRVFCGKKALDVHTMKMHGKEYLQKHAPPPSSSPFTCWFCSAHFTNPELAVEHMTNAHENLDKLSKLVEEQEIPSSTSSLFQEKQIVQKQLEQRGYHPIAPQKQVFPLPPLNHAAAVPTENNHQPPPGFKVSYALAYVPVFVPEKNEQEEEERKNE